MKINESQFKETVREYVDRGIFRGNVDYTESTDPQGNVLKVTFQGEDPPYRRVESPDGKVIATFLNGDWQ